MTNLGKHPASKFSLSRGKILLWLFQGPGTFFHLELGPLGGEEQKRGAKHHFRLEGCRLSHQHFPLPAHLYSHLLLAARLSPLQRLRKVGLPKVKRRCHQANICIRSVPKLSIPKRSGPRWKNSNIDLETHFLPETSFCSQWNVKALGCSARCSQGYVTYSYPCNSDPFLSACWSF